MAQALRRWGYRVNIASNSPDVAYLDNPTRRNDQRPTPVQEVS